MPERAKVVVTTLDRMRCNAKISKNAYLMLPIGDKHFEFNQVGRDQVTNPDWCGKHVSFYICRDKEYHHGVVRDGVDYTDKDVISHGHVWCKRAGCPVCFLNGWLERAARAIVGRLEAGVERGFGEVEHFTVSPRREDWELPYEELKKKRDEACRKRGILACCFIFHGRRIDRKHRRLIWSPHWHGMGFVSGGYEACRNCGDPSWSKCEGCRGFEARTRTANLEDGFIVKVHDKRKTVVGTIRYILSHATYRVGIRRFHIVTYFGLLGCSKMRGHKVKAERVCPVCDSVGVHNVMKRVVYRGKEFIATDIGDLRYKSVFASEEFDASGLPLWEDYGGGGSSG